MTKIEPKSWPRNLGGNDWGIREADSFTTSAAMCGGLKAIEEHIAPVKLGLSKNPKAFLATDKPNVFLAKTKLHWKDLDIIYAYSIWFKIIDSERVVELLWVEWTNPDIGDWMSYGYDPL